MRSWDSVVVQNEKLEHNGKAGRVISAAPYCPEGETADHVEVQLDEGYSVIVACADLKVL